MDIDKFIAQHNPCRDGRLWLKMQPDLKDAWTTCPYANWMLWAAMRFCAPVVVLHAACEVVRQTPLSGNRTVVDLLLDVRSQRVLDTPGDEGIAQQARVARFEMTARGIDDVYLYAAQAASCAGRLKSVPAAATYALEAALMTDPHMNKTLLAHTQADVVRQHIAFPL